MNPPGHHPDAKDFVKVEQGKPYSRTALLMHLFWRLDTRRAHAWGQTLHAPFDGIVRTRVERYPDRLKLKLPVDLIRFLILARRHDPNDLGFFLGNHLVIESDTGVFALLAHLQAGSVQVGEGKRVGCGQALARVGNSGASLQPHVHFHLMAENRVQTSPPLPFVFDAYEECIGGEWLARRDDLPGNRRVFRV